VLVRRGSEFAFANVESGDLRPAPSPPADGGWVRDGGVLLQSGSSFGQVEQANVQIPAFGRYSVSDVDSGAQLFNVDASRIAHSSLRELVVAGPTMGQQGAYTSNLFVVDLHEFEARFVATAEVGFQLPLAADENYIAWSHQYCDYPEEDRRTVRVYGRATGEVTELQTRLGVVEVDGSLLGLSYSGFGVDAWLDLDTMGWVRVMPEGSIHASWSPDRRYASLGGFGGHGGLCG
jgi:hypothetical protein